MHPVNIHDMEKNTSFDNCHCFSTCNPIDTAKFLSSLPKTVHSISSPFGKYISAIYSNPTFPFDMTNLNFFYHNDGAWKNRHPDVEWPMASCTVSKGWLPGTSMHGHRHINAIMPFPSSHKCTPDHCTSWVSSDTHQTTSSENIAVSVLQSKSETSGAVFYNTLKTRSKFVSNEWMEVIRFGRHGREGGPSGSGYGYWFFKAIGSGIFINSNNTFSMKDKTKESNLDLEYAKLNSQIKLKHIFKKSDSLISRQASALWYDTVQIIDSSTTRYFEIVAVGPHEAGSTNGACPPVSLMRGWNASLPCKCDDDIDILNCDKSTPSIGIIPYFLNHNEDSKQPMHMRRLQQGHKCGNGKLRSANEVKTSTCSSGSLPHIKPFWDTHLSLPTTCPGAHAQFFTGMITNHDSSLLDTSTITIAILYYAAPSMLERHLKVLQTYSPMIQKRINILIIDDGSPVNLDAASHVQQWSVAYSHSFISVRVVHITDDIYWNIGGARNLAFHIASTHRVLLLDVDTVVLSSYISTILELPCTMENDVPIMYKFMRRRPNGTLKRSPAAILISKSSYWKNGGCDEDFVGNYGQTDVHFDYRAIQLQKQNFLNIQYRDDIVLSEISHDPICTNSYACKQAIKKWKEPSRDTTINRNIFKRKVKSGCWSTSFLRFKWDVVFSTV